MAKEKKNFCQKCMGACWKGKKNNSATMQAAIKLFGEVPPNCQIQYNRETGHFIINCPFPLDD